MNYYFEHGPSKLHFEKVNSFSWLGERKHSVNSVSSGRPEPLSVSNGKLNIAFPKPLLAVNSTFQLLGFL